MTRLERLNAGLHHDSHSFLIRLSAERDDVADAELATAARSLDGRRLRNVVEAVPALHQQVALVAELVGQPGADDAPGDHGPRLDPGHRHRQPGVREPGLVAGASLDDVAAELCLAERSLELRRKPPRAGPDLLGQAQVFKYLEPAQLLLSERPRGRRLWSWSIDRHEASGSPVADERPVDVGEPEPLHALPPRLNDLALRAIPEHLGRQILAAPPDPLLQVVRMDLEGLAACVSTAHQKVHMRVVRVVVVDGHPIEARSQISLHVRHEGPRVRLEIKAISMLGRDDELPEACVAGPLPASQSGGEVDALALGAEAAPLPALALGTFPRQVRAVRGPGSAPAVPGVRGLNGAALPASVHPRQERTPAASSAPKSAGAPAIAARPAWQRRATTAMARAQSRGELEVVARERHYRSTSKPAPLHVHTGHATARTCDREKGPRYRLSQLFGTRVLTSQNSSAATKCRPQTACGNGRPRLSTSADTLPGRRWPLTTTASGPTSTTSPATATTGLRTGSTPPTHGPGQR